MSGETTTDNDIIIGHTVEPDIGVKVDEIISKPGVLEYVAQVVERTVVGNKLAIRLILLVCAQRGLKNGYGVYLDVNGEYSSGKSYTVRQTLWILPPEIVIDSGMSPQAIYHDNFTEPRIYYIDDFNALDENIKSTLKAVLTNFRRPTVRRVTEKVGNFNATVAKSVPPRTVLIFSACDSVGDQQLMSRLIPLPVEHDEHAKRLQHDYQNDVASGIREDLDAIEDEQTLICREIFRILTDKPLDVIIPFAHEIDWPEIEFKNTRNYNVFLDLIKLCAIFEQRNRTIDDKKRLVATYDDFYKAASIYAPRRSMNSTKLSEGPQKVLDYLMCNYDQDYTQKELVEKLKCNQGNLSRWLETLKEMSLVTEDKGVRQKDTGEKDSYGAPLIRSTFPNVYQYKGEPIVGKITDTPLQLSEKERSKPEYIAWKEAKV